MQYIREFMKLGQLLLGILIRTPYANSRDNIFLCFTNICLYIYICKYIQSCMILMNKDYKIIS